MNFSLKDEELIKKYPHFERMLDEHFELKDKTEKLEIFVGGAIFSKLSDIEKELLNEQLGIMQNFLVVLNKRIEIIREKK